MLPLFFMGWVEDYAHPHSWVQPYMQRSGFFAMNQHFNVVSAALVRPRYVDWSRPETYWNLQELFDYFILWASRTTDPAQAERLYLELNWLAHEYAINVGHIQLTFRHYEQPWVQGWYYNPAFPGTYFYVLSKT